MANLAVKVSRPRGGLRLVRGGGRDGDGAGRVGERPPGRRAARRAVAHALHQGDLRGRLRLPDEGFLHPALFVDDLDAELARHTVLWGPRTVSGTFGTRRIAFVEAPGGIRLEFMEQIEEPPG